MSARDNLVLQRSHLMRPIRMMFPIFEGDLYRGWQVDAAFALLARLGSGKVPLNYRRYAPGQVDEPLPFAKYLPTDRRLQWIIAYTEYQVDWPERLTMDLILEAEARGATACNYTPVTAVESSGDAWRLKTSSGSFLARYVANLTGPWVDGVNAISDAPAKRMVNTTRGAHVVLEFPERFRGHGLMTLSGLDHPFYCFPWRGRHFIGPTEEECGEDPDTVHPEESERAGLLGEIDRQLPGLKDVFVQASGGWAGLRPLTHDPDTQQAVRNRVIHSMTGPGGAIMLALTNGSIGAHAITARDMADCLGLARARGLEMPVTGPDRYSLEAALTQHARHLDDVIWRRMGLVWDPDAGLSEASRIAHQMGLYQGWDDATVNGEVLRYRNLISRLGIV